jgi:hypothetical protein
LHSVSELVLYAVRNNIVQATGPDGRSAADHSSADRAADGNDSSHIQGAESDPVPSSTSERDIA